MFNVDELYGKLNDRMRFINAHKDEIIEAFVAKHECGPEDALLHIPSFSQCEQMQRDGSTKFWIRKMTQEEMEMRDRHLSERIPIADLTPEEEKALSEYLSFIRWARKNAEDAENNL